LTSNTPESTKIAYKNEIITSLILIHLVFAGLQLSIYLVHISLQAPENMLTKLVLVVGKRNHTRSNCLADINKIKIT
jgi:hypothetical protein